MMKTIPNVPACQNMEEIQRLTDLITEFVHPEVIILFGRYAGMSFHNIKGGYEMLILTKNETELTTGELHCYLDRHFPIEERRERHLSFHLLKLDFVVCRSSFSYFLYIIRKEGFLLYQHESCRFKEHLHYRAVEVREHVTAFAQQCLALGDAFLLDARHHWQYGVPRLSAFYLYQANLQFVRAALCVHYGFLPGKKENILADYLAIRYCSEEIAALWYGDGNLSQWHLFGRLQSFCYKARFNCPFPLHPNTLSNFMSFTFRVRRATENFCTERIRFLKEIEG